MRAYKNGVKFDISNTPTLRTVESTAGYLWLGQSYTGVMNGKLNDFRLYDHVLSLKEIKEVARAKILHYTFNDFQEPTKKLAYKSRWFLTSIASMMKGSRKFQASTELVEFPPP